MEEGGEVEGAGGAEVGNNASSRELIWSMVANATGVDYESTTTIPTTHDVLARGDFAMFSNVIRVMSISECSCSRRSRFHFAPRCKIIMVVS